MTCRDLSESLRLTSDEVFERECELCQKKGKRRDANHFCQNCNSYICKICNDAHRRIPALRKHKISQVVNEKHCGLCLSDGKINEANHFCKTCDSYICSLCMDPHETITDLERHILVSCKTVTRHGESATPTGISPALGRLPTKPTGKQSNRSSNFFSQSNTQNQPRRSTRKSAKPELSMCGATTATGLATDTVAQGQVKLLVQPKELFTKLQNDTSNTGCFMSAGEIVLCDNSNKNIKLLDRSLKVKDKLDLKDSPRDIADLEGSNIPATLPSMGQIGRTGFSADTADMSVQTSNKLCIKVQNDTFKPSITGCCFMPAGELVLCDNSNKNIKLLDRHLQVKDKMDLTDSPWDTADLDGSNIAVTLPSKGQIQLIQISPTFSKGRSIQTDMACRGIDVVDEQIYISGRDSHAQKSGKINVYDISWNLKKKLGLGRNDTGLFTSPYYITVSNTSKRLFVSDCGTDTVTCLKSDGQVVWRYKDKELTGPRGLYVDDSLNIIVCNYMNASVHTITAKGKPHKAPILLITKKDINLPCSITFRPADGIFVVGCDVADTIYVKGLL